MPVSMRCVYIVLILRMNESYLDLFQFNQVDRHVLSGRGDSTALIMESPMSLPLSKQNVPACTYRDLLFDSCVAAEMISNELHNSPRSRILLIGPNTYEHVCLIFGCKRAGLPYSCLPDSASG